MEIFIFRIDNRSDMLYFKVDPKKCSLDGQYLNLYVNGSILSFDIEQFDFVFFD